MVGSCSATAELHQPNLPQLSPTRQQAADQPLNQLGTRSRAPTPSISLSSGWGTTEVQRRDNVGKGSLQTSQELRKLPVTSYLPGKSSLDVSPVLTIMFTTITMTAMTTMTMAIMMTMATMRKLKVIRGSWWLYTRKLEVV